ncbi:MAG: hypothetical protein ACRD21_13925 [Vicinamibacteria bacterium]
MPSILRLLFLAEKDSGSDGSELRVKNLQHFSTTLPGSEVLYEVYLDDGRTEHSSYYVSTPIPNPAVTNLEAFAKTLATAIIPAVDRLGASDTSPRDLVPPPLFAEVSSVRFVHRRASIAVSDAIGSTLKRDTMLINTPASHFNFSAIIAGLTSVGGDARVQVQANVSSLSRISGHATIAAVSWIPFPDQPGMADSRVMSGAPAFVGGVLTPEVGIAVGGAFRIGSNITAVAGFIPALRVDALVEGDRPGEMVGDPERPVRSGRATSAFWGLGFEVWR